LSEFRSVPAANNVYTYTTASLEYTGCFTTCRHYYRRWFPRSLWSKKFI